MTPEQIAARLAPFVGANQADSYITSCATEAVELVTHHVGKCDVPGSVLERAALEVGADLYHRRTARNGIAGFEDTEVGTSPIRINRDPLTPARPILAPWLGVPIA